MCDDILASRVFNGSLLELVWDDEEEKGYVRMIDEYGERIANVDSVEDARNLYVHTGLYEDRFVLQAPDWNLPLISGTSLVSQAR